MERERHGQTRRRVSGCPLERQAAPLPKLETDYSIGDTEQLDTRIQAFLETLA